MEQFVTPICLVTDDQYVSMSIIVIISTSVNSKNKKNLIFNIFHPGISKDNLILLKTICNILKVRYALYDISSEIHKFPTPHYYRLIIPQYLAGLYDQIIYLDSDVIVRHDITQLNDLKFGQNIVFACIDYIDKIGEAISNYKELNLDPDKFYFNSGVMVINTKDWIKFEITNKVLKCASENKNYLSAYNRYPQYDQYSLNVILYDKWATLHPFWNYGVLNEYQNCFVAHFNGHGKPWLEFCNKLYKKEFYDYLNMFNLTDLNLPIPCGT